MKLISIIVIVVFFLLALVFSALNLQAIEINLYFATVSMPLALALIIGLLIGVAIGYSAAMISILKLKAKHFQLNKQLNQVNQK